MTNKLTSLLGIDVPIVQAPLAGAGAGPQITAAVCNAGGLGILPVWPDDLPTVSEKIALARTLTDRNFAINLNLNWPQEERLRLCLDAGIGIVSLFWGDPGDLTGIAKRAGAIVMHTVASAADARRAVDSGVDIVVAQGWEAGGHVRGTVATLALVPAVVDAVAPTPVMAAGGISDGRGLAAVLALGASAAWIGTRFLASREIAIHERYRELVLGASEADTEHTFLFDGGWQGAAHRVIRNSTFAAWESAGRPDREERPGRDDVIAASAAGENIMRYQSHTASAGDVGDIEAVSLWCGQGVGLVNQVQTAAEIVSEIHADSRAILQRLGQG